MKEVVVVDPHTVRFVLQAPWPDFMTVYGTLWSAAAWITPKQYFEKVGPDGFKKHPIGLGPYKFVSMKPGIELVMEANENYWRKVPSVKRLVYISVPEATTRLAMLKRGEVDLAYLLDGQLGESIRNDPQLKLAFSGGIGTHHLDFLDMWDPKSPWADPRVRKAASLAIDRKALSEAETLGASKPTGGVVLKSMEYALPLEPDPYDPAQAKKLLAEAGYPNGFDGGDLTPIPPYSAPGEIVANYLGAVGIRMKLRTMERAAFFSAFQGKKLKGRVLLHHRGLRQRLDAAGGKRAEHRHLRLWRLARCRRTLQAAADRNRPEEARGNAAPDAADPARAHPLRADLRLFLGQRHRPPRRRRRADEDRPLPLGRAAGRREIEAAVTGTLKAKKSQSRRKPGPTSPRTESWNRGSRLSPGLPNFE